MTSSPRGPSDVVEPYPETVFRPTAGTMMEGVTLGAPVPMESDGTPTMGEKTPEPKKPPPGRPPFKLCFKLAKVRGRSDISPCHPRGFVQSVTGKFYSLKESSCEREPDVEAVNRAYNTGPRQKHNDPYLESHRYGWYHDVTFVDSEILNDRRFNFHKRTGEIFRTTFYTNKK